MRRVDRQAWVSGPSTSPLAVAMKRLWPVFGAAALGALNSISDGEPPHRPSAVVMISDRPPGCIVRQNSGEHGHEIPCKEVARYLLDDLHLKPGALVEIDIGGNVAPDVVSGTSKEISREGFGLTEGVRVGFLSEPGIEKRAVAVISIWDKSPTCTVRKNPRDPGRDIPCEQVGGYLLDDLKIPCGAFVGTAAEGRFNLEGYRALINGMSSEDFDSAGSGGVIRRCGRDR